MSESEAETESEEAFETRISSGVSESAGGGTNEDERLGMGKPLRTIFYLSVGPLISQMVQAFYGLADSLWVAKTIGERGVSVFGCTFIVEFIAVAVANYLMSGLSVMLSFLYGEGRTDKCGQMYVDFVRVAIIFGIVIPCIVMPLTGPVVKWFGAEDDLVEMCLEYMYPLTCGCFLNFLYLMGCGVVQAEGRSILYAIIQVSSFALNLGVFDPLFLVGLKTGMWGASLSTIISQGIPGIILTVLILKGKFALKPNARMFISKPSKETQQGLRLGLSSLMSIVSYSLPMILMQKYVNNASKSISNETYETVVAIWAVIEKLYQLVGGVCIGFSLGMSPAASYAFGAKRLNRTMWLYLHTTWVATAISLVFAIIIIIRPHKICLIWSRDEEFVYWARRMVPKVFYTTLLIGYQYTTPCLLQAMQRVLASALLSILTLLLPMPVFSSILYFTDKTDPARVLWTYALNDGFSAIACSLFLISPGKLLWRAPLDSSLKLVNGRIEESPAEEEQEEEQEQDAEEVVP